MSFPDSDAIARIEEKLDDMEFDEKRHHEHCPMSYKLRSTSCFCDRLDAADRAAAAEFRADCELDR